ncbi:MAG: potassium transporter Kup [Chloroflexi bacterium]|nr:potassium transporter Kup [Chloroflexota bacterium]
MAKVDDVKRKSAGAVDAENGRVRHQQQHGAVPVSNAVALLALAALGVVYGDIGTSPLYALRECFHGLHAIAPTPDNVLGVLSLIFWSLIVVVTVKYLVFVLRADNRGEGGILALTSLAAPVQQVVITKGRWIVVLGLFGAALLYGDGIITPAISVLSAVEGLKIATPLFDPYVIPMTVVILIALFLIQSRGTGDIGRLFGPVMLVWFVTLALLGLSHLVQYPAVLAAINPLRAVTFFQANGWAGFLILGTVFLVVTGGEALYADMGHFGRRPIRLAWFTVVLPALLLNYFGQGALIILDPGAVENPFYLLAPDWALYPLVVLATCATVIASQTLISGAFSITMQAIQFGVLPRLRIFHTSHTQYGQIYIPAVNWALMLACIAVVLGFQSSTHLAAAYGVAVTSTMAITTIIFYVVARERWHWSALQAGLLSGFFLVVDLAFLGANLLKIPQGGWFPLVVAGAIMIVMVTWKDGRRLVWERLYDREMSINTLLARLKKNPPERVPGTAIYLSSNPVGAPSALLSNINHYHALHEKIILVTVNTEEVSQIPENERVKLEDLGQGFQRMTITYGFMDDRNIPEVIKKVRLPNYKIDPQQVTYFVNRTRVVPSELPGMALWREKFFAVLTHNAATVADFFCLPPAQVVEIGTQVEV